jgi:hypothetical protein
MTSLPSSSRLRALLVGFTAWQVACSAPRAPTPVVTPTKAAAEPLAAPSARPEETPPEVNPAGATPAEVNSPGATQAEPTPLDAEQRADELEEAVKRVAKRNLWPLPPPKAEALLKSLGAVSRNEPMPQALELSGGPSGALARFQVAYSGDEKGHWTFNVATFYLGDPDLRRLHASVEKQLTQLLGKPKWVNGSDELASAGWGLGHSMELLFAPSPNSGEKLLLISISEPEGEEE